MDLAEIRKKAKVRKDAGGAKKTSDTVPPLQKPTASTQGLPAAEPAILGAESRTQVPLLDPLEQLFSLRNVGNLASEEVYEETLQSKQSQSEDELHQWLTFPLGTEEYALDINSIREIIKLREITDVPRVPEFILGIISLRGIIIPVFDLKKRLRLGTVEFSPSCRIIVCQHEDKMAGLLVEGITQVIRIPVSNIEPPPGVLSGIDRELVEGVGRTEGKMTILLDLTNVLNSILV